MLCMLYAFSSFAQSDFEIDWSKKINYEKHTFGDFIKFAGGNEKYVYAIFEPMVSKEAKTNKLLVAFDKSTMKELGKLKLNSSQDFKNICIGNNVVYAVYMIDEVGKENIYMQTYTSSLEPIAAKTKVASIKTSDRKLSKKITNTTTLINKKANDNIYILNESPKEKDESIEMNFKIVDKNLIQVNSGSVVLPIVNTSGSTEYNSTRFSIGDDGSIICKNTIKADREMRRNEKIASYAVLNVVNPMTKTNNYIPIKAQDKSIIDYEYFTLNKKLHVVGIFKETVGAKSQREQGIFSSILNTATNELENIKYTSIANRNVDFSILYLEKMHHDDAGNVIMYAGEDENITRTDVTRDSRGNTTRHTTYENRKGDILAAYINADGSIKWNTVIERKISYPVLNVRDIHSMFNNTNSYITYATKIKSGKKSFFNKYKSNKDLSNIIDYARVTNDNGTLSRKEFKLNKDNAEKNTTKSVSATTISEIDNQLYLNGFDVKMKTGPTIIGCLTTPLCCAGLLYWKIKSDNGSLYEGGGYLGTLKIKD
jgi:hypothetical protein